MENSQSIVKQSGSSRSKSFSGAQDHPGAQQATFSVTLKRQAYSWPTPLWENVFSKNRQNHISHPTSSSYNVTLTLFPLKGVTERGLCFLSLSLGRIGLTVKLHYATFDARSWKATPRPPGYLEALHLETKPSCCEEAHSLWRGPYSQKLKPKEHILSWDPSQQPGSAYQSYEWHILRVAPLVPRPVLPANEMLSRDVLPFLAPPKLQINGQNKGLLLFWATRFWSGLSHSNRHTPGHHVLDSIKSKTSVSSVALTLRAL